MKTKQEIKEILIKEMDQRHEMIESICTFFNKTGKPPIGHEKEFHGLKESGELYLETDGTMKVLSWRSWPKIENIMEKTFRLSWRNEKFTDKITKKLERIKDKGLHFNTACNICGVNVHGADWKLNIMKKCFNKVIIGND